MKIFKNSKSIIIPRIDGANFNLIAEHMLMSSKLTFMRDDIRFADQGIDPRLAAKADWRPACKPSGGRRRQEDHGTTAANLESLSHKLLCEIYQ